MAAVFDELGQALLILGAPGSGKTTLLLEIARDLLDRAVQETNHPIPVIFHLSSWTTRRRPLADWIVDELTERYYVPRKLAQLWTDAKQVLPLLDGLDEVALDHRAACVEAINTFRRQHPLVPLTVCSRAADYQALPVRVELSGAVVIKPLSRVQVSSYLKQTGKSLAGVRTVLRDDQTLWELLQTPLMLSIVALAYQGRSAAEVRATGSLEQRRIHLFENYTRRMIERRKVTEYTPEQTIRWLSWLARSLMRNNLSVFYVEWMQPDWLPSRAQRRIVVLVPMLLFGSVAGLACGLVMGPFTGLGAGLTLGLIVGVLGRGRITPVETLRWSWIKARSELVPFLVRGLILGSITGLVAGLADKLVSGLVDGGLVYKLFNRLVTGSIDGGLAGGMVAGLAAGFVYGLAFGSYFALVRFLARGLTTDQIITRAIPNEGIRQSLRNGVICFLAGALVFGPLTVPVLGLAFGPFASLANGLGLGLFIGLAFGAINGGLAYLQHYVLRILLWRNNCARLNYIRFLDYAAERVFLRKVGGGYIFTHRLLMEYFATLQTDQTRQTQTA